MNFQSKSSLLRDSMTQHLQVVFEEPSILPNLHGDVLFSILRHIESSYALLRFRQVNRPWKAAVERVFRFEERTLWVRHALIHCPPTGLTQCIDAGWLRSLDLRYSYNGGLDDDIIVQYTKLKKLDLSNCFLVTDRAVSGLTALHTLGLQHCNGVTDASVSYLTGLYELNLCYCTKLTDASVSLLTALNTLNLTGCVSVTDHAISLLTALHTLYLHRCTQLTNVSVSVLTRLSRLDLGDCHQITDAAVSRLVALKSLDLSSCDRVTDASVSLLTGLSHLDVAYCPRITKASVSTLTSLETLYCRDSGILLPSGENLIGWSQIWSYRAGPGSNRSLKSLWC